jgi:hypothetical protein
MLRAFGAGERSPRDWGETAALPHVSSLSSREVSGFTAHYDFGFMETQIAANIKYGTLVIQSYNSFRDGSGRPAYFNREFFYQDLGAEPSPTQLDAPGESPDLPCQMAGDDPGDGAGALPGAVDLSPFLGSWRNTYRDSKGIRRFILARQADRYVFRGWGVGRDEDWGTVPVVPHAPQVASRQPAGFLTRYDFAFSQVTLAVNENKGLLVVAAFTTFRDGTARSSYLTREFFYREGNDPTT